MEENDNILGLRKDMAEMKYMILSMAATINKMANGSRKVSQKAYAAHRGVSVNSIIDQMKKGLYGTPEGYTEPCFDRSGRRGSPMFVPDLADLYYSINVKNR